MANTTKSATKVTVGCKLPNGFIMQVGQTTHIIKGFNSSNVSSGVGITSDVPADLWKAWLAENKDRALVKNGHVFAYANRKDVEKEAGEKKDNPSGTEGLTPPPNNEVK